MNVRMFTVGMFSTNCYVLDCQEKYEAIIIDPGFDEQSEAEKIFSVIDKKAVDLKYIVNTHGHPDHTCGNGAVKKKFNVPILIHKDDAYMIGRSVRTVSEQFKSSNFSPQADVLLENGGLIEFGRATLNVLHTPSHTGGSISLLGKNEVFTGDTLFAGSIGRTDFPESSEDDVKLSLKKLARLLDQLVVYPGHGPTTTLGQEKVGNPFWW